MLNHHLHLKHIVDQLIGAGNMDILATAFSPDYIAHAGEKTHKGHAFIRRYTGQVRTALPDIKLVQMEIISESAEMVTWQRIFSGTHQADLLGIPASGQKVKWYEIVVSRFEQDLIVEEWLASDLAFQLMLKQK